jgi:hypothetical protein
VCVCGGGGRGGGREGIEGQEGRKGVEHLVASVHKTSLVLIPTCIKHTTPPPQPLQGTCLTHCNFPHLP